MTTKRITYRKNVHKTKNRTRNATSGAIIVNMPITYSNYCDVMRQLLVSTSGPFWLFEAQISSGGQVDPFPNPYVTGLTTYRSGTNIQHTYSNTSYNYSTGVSTVNQLQATDVKLFHRTQNGSLPAGKWFTGDVSLSNCSRAIDIASALVSSYSGMTSMIFDCRSYQTNNFGNSNNDSSLRIQTSYESNHSADAYIGVVPILDAIPFTLQDINGFITAVPSSPPGYSYPNVDLTNFPNFHYYIKPCTSWTNAVKYLATRTTNGSLDSINIVDR